MSGTSIYPFAHLPQYAVLVCQLCQFACLADEAPRHVQQRHEDISREERRRIAQSVLSVPNLLRNTGDLHLLAKPCPEEPIPFLAAPKSDGLKCRKCSYISRHVQKMQSHCRKKHGWQNPRGAGRPLVELGSQRSCRGAKVSHASDSSLLERAADGLKWGENRKSSQEIQDSQSRT